MLWDMTTGELQHQQDPDTAELTAGLIIVIVATAAAAAAAAVLASVVLTAGPMRPIVVTLNAVAAPTYAASIVAKLEGEQPQSQQRWTDPPAVATADMGPADTE